MAPQIVSSVFSSVMPCIANSRKSKEFSIMVSYYIALSVYYKEKLPSWQSMNGSLLKVNPCTRQVGHPWVKVCLSDCSPY
jgi:hypothetical protein